MSYKPNNINKFARKVEKRRRKVRLRENARPVKSKKEMKKVLIVERVQNKHGTHRLR